MKKQEKKKEGVSPSISAIHAGIIAAFFFAVGIGLACDVGIGTLSSMGIGAIASICPLGTLETLIAGMTALPRVFVVLAVFVVLGILFGRAFCGWVCPVAPLSRLVGRTGRKANKTNGAANEVPNAASKADAPDACAPDACAPNARIPRPKRVKVDSRHWILGGTLLSSALFGFPVFCLVCPIGLVFAIFIAVWRTFEFAEPTWSLVVFPAILLVELLVLRKWCHRFCPLGALMSLLASVGGKRGLTPKVDASVCLRANGAECRSCVDACPEGIDPHLELSSMPLSECTRCGKCIRECPAKALQLSFKQ